jgi:C-terminal processing protease CtpA/Prc
MHMNPVIRMLHASFLFGALLCAIVPASPSRAQNTSGASHQADMQIDAKRRQHIIDNLVLELNQGYVFPELAKKVEHALRQHQKRGVYDGIVSAEKFTEVLNEHLQRETKDRHLQVHYSEQAIPEQNEDRKASSEELAAELADMKARNFGIERVERLPFNIGYIDLRLFAASRDAAGSIAAMMTLVSNTDALIFDLRKNGGGDPNTVTLIASYLLDERTHLSDIYYREGNRTTQMWSSDYVTGNKFGQTKDVYILTSKHTFSAAEDFSYALKNLKRATIVGEASGGGAHPGDFVRLDTNFMVFVPGGRSISPITKTDWEGTGVIPDVSVPAEDAFRTAQLAILQKMLKVEKNANKIERLKARIDKVSNESTAGSMAR